MEDRPGCEREEEEQDGGRPAEADQPGDVDGLHGGLPPDFYSARAVGARGGVTQAPPRRPESTDGGVAAEA